MYKKVVIVSYVTEQMISQSDSDWGLLAWPMFSTTHHGAALTFLEHIHKLVQYLSALHTFEIWVKHRHNEYSTSICDYNYDFLCYFTTTGENPTHTKTRMWESDALCQIDNFSANKVLSLVTIVHSDVLLLSSWKRTTSQSSFMLSFVNYYTI